jgi:hypothetical protein
MLRKIPQLHILHHASSKSCHEKLLCAPGALLQTAFPMRSVRRLFWGLKLDLTNFLTPFETLLLYKGSLTAYREAV